MRNKERKNDRGKENGGKVAENKRIIDSNVIKLSSVIKGRVSKAEEVRERKRRRAREVEEKGENKE